MADLGSLGYSAGYLGEEAKRQNWAHGLAGFARAAGSIAEDSIRLSNAVMTQEDNKIDDWWQRDATGDEIAGQSSEGWMDEAQKRAVLDPDNTLKIYEDMWNQNVTVDRIMSGAGVSRSAAERWIKNQGAELHGRVSDYAQYRQDDAYKTKIYDDQKSYGMMLSANPDMSADGFRAQYTERLNSLGLDPESSLYKSLSLENPENAMLFSQNYAEARTKFDIEQNAKNGFMTKQDAIDAAEALFRQNAPDAADDPSLQYQIDMQVEEIKKNAGEYYDEITTGVVNDSAERMAQGSQEYARMVQENPEFVMSDEDFERFIREDLGMDPDNNEIDMRNATALYEAIMQGNDAASNAAVADWLSAPENRKALDDAFASLEEKRLNGSPVSSRTYSFTAEGTVARDSEGNVIQGAVLPSSEEQYVSGSAAFNTIFRAYDAQRMAEEGAEDIISTEYGDIVDLIPEELRQDPETFKAAVNYIENYGTQRYTLMSASMGEKAMNLATNISYTEQERRNLLAQMFAAREIDQDSYTEALGKIDFQYKEERDLVLGMMKSYIDVQGDAMPDHLYDQMTSNIDFLDGLDKWIISWKQNGGTIQSAGAEQYIQNQVSIFGTALIKDEMNADFARTIPEIIDGDMLVGNTYALSESNPSKLVQMRDEGELMWVRNDVCTALRTQLMNADSSLTTGAEDILETASQMIFQNDYENLSDVQKSMVDIHATLAVYDQTNFEMLHDTFIAGQNLEGFHEVSIRTGNGTRVGLLGSDGYVYFLPNCSYDQNQAASYFYVGTNSDVYNRAMSGDDVRIDLAGYALGTYKKPSADQIKQRERPAEGPSSISDWKDYVSVTRRGSVQDVTIDNRLWDVVNEDNIDEFMNMVSRDPELKRFYGQIQNAWGNYIAYGYSFDQTHESTPTPEGTPGFRELTAPRVYSVANDPMLIVGKKNIMMMQVRKNNG